MEEPLRQRMDASVGSRRLNSRALLVILLFYITSFNASGYAQETLIDRIHEIPPRVPHGRPSSSGHQLLEEKRDQGSRHAYVSLIYDDSFLLGLRVLGLSLKESGTQNDMVALVAGNVSSLSLDTLKGDGWRIKQVETLMNPGQWSQSNRHGAKFPARFWGVYTKLMVWNLTQYTEVVYLDADTIVLRNLDELFLCDGFCGVMRHSERLNTGVMVLQPSADLLDDMLKLSPETPSYTGGDQGFLNKYFSNFPNSVLFDPAEGKRLSDIAPLPSEEGRDDEKGLPRPRIGRLPTSYNADLGLYVANSNRWTVPVDTIGVVHYTLGSFKPWDWWSSWILGENGRRWQQLRVRLPSAADGTTKGATHWDSFVTWVALPLPWLLILIGFRKFWLSPDRSEVVYNSVQLWKRRSHHKVNGSAVNGSANGTIGTALSQSSVNSHARTFWSSVKSLATPKFRRPAYNFPLGFSACAILAGTASVCIGLLSALQWIVPRQIVPWKGWILAYEWTMLFITMLFGAYLWLCYGWGGAAVARSSMLTVRWSTRDGASISPKELKESLFWLGSRPWGETLIGMLVLVLTLGLVPWWADLLGSTSLVGKVMITAVAGAISVTIAGQCFIGMAKVWFTCGAMEGNTVIGSPRNSV